jgi:hypothetical protein
MLVTFRESCHKWRDSLPLDRGDGQLALWTSIMKEPRLCRYPLATTIPWP